MRGAAALLASVVRPQETPDVAGNFAAIFAAGDVWFEANPSYLTVDGSNNVTEIIDRNDASHKLLPGVAGTLVSSDAQLAGAAGVQTSASTYYDSNRTASAWSFLHAPSPGCTWACGAVVTSASNGRWWTTSSGEGAGSVGAVCIVNSNAMLVGTRSFSESAQPLDSIIGAPNIVTPRALHTMRFTGVSGGAFNTQWDATAATRSGTIGTASTAAPSRTFRLMSDGTLAYGNTSSVWRFFFAWQRVLNSTELAAVTAYVAATCGGTI